MITDVIMRKMGRVGSAYRAITDRPVLVGFWHVDPPRDLLRLDQMFARDIEAALADWSLAPVVRALQALRRMALVVAATLSAELGDITRFDNPRQLMANSLGNRQAGTATQRVKR